MRSSLSIQARKRSLFGTPILIAMVFVGCSSAKTNFFDPADPNPSDPNDPTFGGGADGGGNIVLKAPDAGAQPAVCAPDPGNFEIPNNGCDDDGDGMIDNAAPACDTGLATTGDASDFAKAIGLCKQATNGSWGVVSATYTQGYQSSTEPAAAQHGIYPTFGTSIKAREGANLGVLSSGMAGPYDTCNDADKKSFKGGCPETGAGTAPPGYPKQAGTCPIGKSVNDVSAVKLVIKVPNNAKGFGFDFDFYSGEWPEFVCTEFNDAFIAYLTSKSFNNGKADNISFDSKNDPVSVNNGFFDRCAPANATVGCAGNGKPPAAACAGGSGELAGTGFLSTLNQAFGGSCGQKDSGGGATGWLTTQSPVTPGETITLEFMIWDTGDQSYDSSVLLDNWSWQGADVTVGTVRPPN